MKKANERLSTAGAKLAQTLKKLGELSDDEWGKSFEPIANLQMEIDTLRHEKLEAPLVTKFLDLMSQSLIHDKENFQNTHKKLTTTIKRMDARAAKLQLAIKSGKGNKV